MSQPAATLSRRATLLAFTLAVVLSILFLLPPRPAAAFICEDGYPSYVILYYNNAQHTTVVGNCIRSCTQVTCSGQQTIYSLTIQEGCCSFD